MLRRQVYDWSRLKTSSMQNSEQSASSRHLLLDYEFIQGNFPAIVTTQPLTPHKLAAIQDPLINTEKLVGKEYFDTSALFTSARNKEKWRPDRSAATLALACKKSFRGHPKNVVKCESVTVESPLALAKTLSAKGKLRLLTIALVVKVLTRLSKKRQKNYPYHN